MNDTFTIPREQFHSLRAFLGVIMLANESSPPSKPGEIIKRNAEKMLAILTPKESDED